MKVNISYIPFAILESIILAVGIIDNAWYLVSVGSIGLFLATIFFFGVRVRTWN